MTARRLHQRDRCVDAPGHVVRLRDRVDSEGGNVTLFAVIFMFALYLAVAMVVDGGRVLDARRDVYAAVAAAARAGAAQTVDEANTATFDPTLVRARVERVLAATGYQDGGVVVGAGQVTVSAATHVNYLLFPFGGGRDVTATASVLLLTGVSSAVNR